MSRATFTVISFPPALAGKLVSTHFPAQELQRTAAPPRHGGQVLLDGLKRVHVDNPAGTLITSEFRSAPGGDNDSGQLPRADWREGRRQLQQILNSRQPFAPLHGSELKRMIRAADTALQAAPERTGEGLRQELRVLGKAVGEARRRHDVPAMWAGWDALKKIINGALNGLPRPADPGIGASHCAGSGAGPVDA